MSRQTDRTAAINFDHAACGEPDTEDFDVEGDDGLLGLEEYWHEEVTAFYRGHIIAGTTLIDSPLPNDVWVDLINTVDAEQDLTVEEYEQIKRISRQRDSNAHQRIRRGRDLELLSAITADGEAEELRLESVQHLG